MKGQKPYFCPGGSAVRDWCLLCCGQETINDSLVNTTLRKS
jgi:hypothetical protein